MVNRVDAAVPRAVQDSRHVPGDRRRNNEDWPLDKQLAAKLEAVIVGRVLNEGSAGLAAQYE
jgi:hypothetical protein